MTFEQLEDLFYQLKIQASPSGFHGFLCGRLSCGAVQMEDLINSSTAWLGLEEEAAEAAVGDLESFYEATLSDLQDISFLFQPLLPDDELPLAERLISVGDWCTNYLSGLGDGMGAEFDISEDGKEALQDIAAIGQISTDLVQRFSIFSVFSPPKDHENPTFSFNFKEQALKPVPIARSRGELSIALTRALYDQI